MIGIATFAAGCFWRVEAMFAEVPGVLSTAVGYTGGATRWPTYAEVCDGGTGHAEAVQLDYDPRVVGYHELLELFWQMHDATRRRAKRQYRSAIFTGTPDQFRLAYAMKAELEAVDGHRLLTEIEPLRHFYRAEDRHQQYFAKHGRVVAA